MSLHTLLPLRGLVITLRCTATARLAFFHQPALTAFLRFLAGSPDQYDQLIRIDTPESGRVSYRAGEHYRFLLLGLAGSEALLDALLAGLAGLPQSAPKQGEGLPFADNWRLEAVQDMFTGNPVSSLAEACCYDVDALQAEVALWEGKQQVQWQWLSPALLLKDKQQREAEGVKAKGEARYVRDAPDLSGALLCSRVHTAVADLLRRRGETQTMPLTTAPPVEISAAHLFWLEAGYRGADHQYQSMGGVSGHLSLHLPANLALGWWELLVLGQYLGMGQRTTFGWGRYLLVDAEGGQSYRRVFPASSLLMLAQTEENLSQAWAYVQAGQDIPDGLVDEPEVARWYLPDDEDDDAVSIDADAEEAIPSSELPLEQLQADLERVLHGTYQPPVAQGYWLPKTSGGMHLLAVAPTYDRVLQRAVQQVLAHTLGALLAAQREGRDTDPGQAIRQAWAEGYRWVYEGDIQDFFGSIDLERLRGRLVAVYHNDPVVAAILGWLRAEVVCAGESVARTRGLPLGSPLSPLLAELMRDDVEHQRSAAAPAEQASGVIIHEVGQRERTGSFVTVTGDPAVLTTSNGQLHVYRKDELLMQLPWNSIEMVLLLGNHQVTTQAMHTALDEDIPIHLASGKGNYKGCITHNRNSQHQSLWVQQILAFQDEAKVLACAKEVVQARLIHMKETLRHRQLAEDLPVINGALRKLPKVDSLASLLGYEGSSTREYFARIASVLPVDFRFEGRNRRPPRDPFNVLLSLGYTQLYSLTESVVHTVGLLPWQGFYHQPRGRHAVLASDLMEPFRHLVERSALSMVARGEIVATDFRYTPERACLISDAARRKFLALLMQGWENKLTARGDDAAKSWLDQLRAQALSLKGFVTKGEAFHAFRAR
ncbi:CRISPR-associated endonuclease Cas1 [Thiothrix fructosivorans]|uniref:CRISPR-associated endonuclease Cas1 n=1 Tax=Thiothrix fructosivorans TaxID=111770 RepID=A0A8B0SI54_9GAMM|nr:CRISPR-associated endonuclease Cas1 [Thiothrix fructosivorans]MBO0615366.1 CRISPR-associated endonuclease Cas1 [Thiothrix fructosivorans]QTX10140.1 CRISPR-associated endonuclease Cas1 [Thiothrix fructosivorans]